MLEKWRIEEHMEVVDRAGRHVGTVDCVQGDQITLTKSDSPEGTHRYVPLAAVDEVESNRVVLKEGVMAMSEVEIAVASRHYSGRAATPGGDTPLFGTSGTGTGMGGSGRGEH